MNAERRKKISVLVGQLSEIKDAIETLKDEEQEYYDNMPESFQNGDKGEAATTAIDQLEQADTSLQEVVDALEEASQ